MAVGIDEAGINDDNDMLQEMRLVQKIHRLPGVRSAYVPTSHQILHMATVNGAKATLFDSQVGILEPGKRADAVLVDLTAITEPYLHPDTDMVDALVYRGRASDVKTVVVDGEVLMRDGRITKVDKDAVWAELKQHMNRPLAQNEIDRANLGRDLLPYVNRFYEEWGLPGGRPHYLYNEAE